MSICFNDCALFITLLPLQGVTNERALPQGVASLALGYVLLPFQGELSAALAKSETLKTYYFNTCTLIILCSSLSHYALIRM